MQLTGSAAQVIYFLSGLTCDDENFINKAGAQVVSCVRHMSYILLCDALCRGCSPAYLISSQRSYLSADPAGQQTEPHLYKLCQSAKSFTCV